jgi:transposase
MPPVMLDRAMNGPMIPAYVNQCRVPIPKRGEGGITDNLPLRNVAGVHQMIEATGAELLYLPPCVPDLNQIEMAFDKLSTLLREAAERTIPDRLRDLGRVAQAFSPGEHGHSLRRVAYLQM